jgi:Galactose oxidase, central domain/Kelch motif
MKRRLTAPYAPARRSLGEGGFFNLPGSIAVLICVAAGCSMVSGALLTFFRPQAPAKVSERMLTFAERVAYQRAIEDVYWRHRIWPKDNPDSKPSLDAVMSQAQLEKKVEDYLRKSQMLEDHWQRPITVEQLQAEMDRMAHHTKQPDVLRELFAALDNDPFIVAECLARPALSDRLLTDLSAHDKELLTSWRSVADNHMPRLIAAASANYTLPNISDGTGCTGDTWTLTSTVNAPSARAFHTAVWTGSEMIVWGGSDGSNTLNTGGRYNPATDSWTATSTNNAPDHRYEHTAVWTGSEMIIWGGWNGYINLYLGGRYNPSTDSWTATASGPDARWVHTAVWTGSEMIIWGGNSFGGVLFDGARYNPSSNSWTATSNTHTPTRRYGHTAVWTGSEMIVWGGSNADGSGGRYNPSTDSWTATSTTNAPTVSNHTTVWTGSEMIVWGGFNYPNVVNTGGRYNPGTDSWTATTNNNAPQARWFHTAVWTDSEMIVWGGCFGNPCSNFVDTGGRYDPGTDSWTATSTTNAPSARAYHTAVWTGSEMIVWGGQDNSGNYLDTGGRYCAAAPSSTPTPTPTATPTSTPTATQPPPSPTATATPTVTPPSPTPTSTPTPRATPTPRFVPTPRPRATPAPRP